MIAAKAIAFGKHSARVQGLCGQIVKNARVLGEALQDYGYRLVTGGLTITLF